MSSVICKGVVSFPFNAFRCGGGQEDFWSSKVAKSTISRCLAEDITIVLEIEMCFQDECCREASEERLAQREEDGKEDWRRPLGSSEEDGVQD